MMNDEKSPSGYPEATFGLSGSQPVGTRKPPLGYPEATLRLPHSLPKASPKSESSGAGALGALALHRKEQRTSTWDRPQTNTRPLPDCHHTAWLAAKRPFNSECKAAGLPEDRWR